MVTTTSQTQVSLPQPEHPIAGGNPTDQYWWRWFKQADAILRAINTDLTNVTLDTLAAASRTQTAEFISGGIAVPANQDYQLVIKIPHGGTITEATTRCVSGTCTATFKVNTTALGGTANSVSSSKQSQAHSSTNTFAADDDIVVTISSNSACVGLSFTLKYTRTYA
jgi:hypothetical protein